MPGETLNQNSEQVDNQSNQENEWTNTSQPGTETITLDAEPKGNEGDFDEDDVNIELIDDMPESGNTEEGKDMPSEEDKDGITGSDHEAKETGTSKDDMHYAKQLYVEPTAQTESTKEPDPRDTRIHDVEKAHYMARAEKPFRDEIDAILDDRDKRDIEAAKKGEVAGFSEADLYEIAKLNEKAEKEAQRAEENYDRKKIGEKLLNGIRLTEQEQAIVDRIIEKGDNSQRELQQREAERQTALVKENIRQEQERDEKNAMIEGEINSIVYNEDHPLHKAYVKEYQKIFEMGRSNYDSFAKSLEEIKRKIENGELVGQQDIEAAEYQKEAMAIYEDHVKKAAYNNVKLIANINEALGQEPDGKPSKKKSIFQKILGK